MTQVADNVLIELVYLKNGSVMERMTVKMVKMKLIAVSVNRYLNDSC